MGAINLFHDALDALWDCVDIRLVEPADRLLLKQRVQGLLCAFDDATANVFGRFGTHELDSNRVRLAAAVRELYEGEGESTESIERIFDTSDAPEYAAMTEVLIRFLAVRDFMVPDSDSDSDSD